MDRRLIAFLLLIGVLVLAQIYMIERFYGGSSKDCSGSDCSDSSGSSTKGDITLSLSDLLTLLSSKKPDTRSGLSSKNKKYNTNTKEILEPTGDMLYDATGDVYYSSLKGDILDEIKSSVHDEVAANRTLLVGGSSGDSSSCDSGCESFATMQGSGFIKRKGVEYVRTDSIPCYGCSLK